MMITFGYYPGKNKTARIKMCLVKEIKIET